MINLLPDDKKKELISDYAMRVALTGLCALFFVELAALAAFVPSYLAANAERNMAMSDLAVLKDSGGPSDSTALQAITAIDTDVALMTPKPSDASWSRILGHIERMKTPGISLFSVMYESINDQRMMHVRGKAADRDVFFALRSRLMNDPAYAKIEMPSSAFIKEKDIDFSAVLTLR